jgi:hypothetical protein
MAVLLRAVHLPNRARLWLTGDVRFYLLLPLVGACFYFTPPAARSPLKEKLAPLSSNELEDATRGCLQKAGWKVDELVSEHGGIRVLHGKKGNDDGSLYLYAEGIAPRITGELANDNDAFWTCLASGARGDKPDVDKVDADAAAAHDS